LNFGILTLVILTLGILDFDISTHRRQNSALLQQQLEKKATQKKSFS
jgi:hypothetical protein